jgi:hypothetical protein
LFLPNQPQNRCRRDAEDDGNFADRHFPAGPPLSFTVDGDRVVVAQGANSFRRPTLPVCCAPSIPIQDRGDSRVGFDPRQHANNLHEVVVGYIPMPATAKFWELHLRVISALPMQHQTYSFCFRRGNNLFQSDPQEALFVLRRTTGIIPKSGEVSREGQKLLLLCIGEWALTDLL